MSYILDALRKADAQRERDASRGIHAQAAAMGPAVSQADSGSRTGCFAMVAATGVIAAVAGWYLTRSEPAPIAPAAAVVFTPQMPVAATTISPPPPAPVAPPPMVPAPVQARETAFTARGTAMPSTAAAPVALAASAPLAAPIAGGLPPDAPRIAISGGVYSPNPAQRMLIVNGQVFNEGSEVAPGVKVEAIQQRTAVLGFRGARYTVAY